MLVATSPNFQNLLPQLSSFCGQFPMHPSHRLGLLRRGPEIQKIRSIYQTAVNQVPKEKWEEILAGARRCFPQKLWKQKRIVLPLDNVSNLVVQPASGQIYVQRRGFSEKRTTPKGVGKTSATEHHFIKSGIFGRIFGSKTQKTEKDYQEILKNMKSESEKSAFNYGYTFASTHGKISEKSGLLSKVFNTVCIVLFIFVTVKIIWPLLFGRGYNNFKFLGDSDSEVKPEDIAVTFEDVRGLDEAKKEVEEIVDYLRDPMKYTRLGGRLPKGVLLVGPPGTGKTLLARAIAGEAGVPFFHAAGSEFDEVLVGQGARRVRDLFEKAKTRAPCIIFIDEIDSVGSKRVSDGLHPYANQTINQLLSEMDGFKRNEGVIVLGATNRVEDLDRALLRPGRFDSRVHVNIPDFTGRRDIFELYLSRITHGKLSLDVLAKGTIGFTGADIENMVNQAALKAASENVDRVAMRHLDEAKDRILMGPARVKGRIPDEETNKNTAYHEAGHALVAYYTKDAQPIHKVTIIQRGPSLGHTSFLPEQDSYQVTRSQLMAQLDTLMGGRVAEELILGREKVTTGASDDLRKATELALRLIKQYGMGPALRDYTVELEKNRIVATNDLGPMTMENLDKEVNHLLEESYNRAKEILTKHKKEHVILAEALFEYETLSAEEVKSLLEGGKITRQTETKIPNILPILPLKKKSNIVNDSLVKKKPM